MSKLSSNSKSESTKSTTTNIRIRTTDDLFEKLSISDIRSVVGKTTTKLQSKRLELKELVGSKYQDLLESADSVMRMYEHGNQLNLSLKRIENATEQLIESISTSTIRKKEEIHQRKENESLMEARRIKSLIESPESVWQAIDDGDLLLATSEFLRARKNYSELRSSKRHVSLWNRRWCSMQNLPKVICMNALCRLEKREKKKDIPVKAYADAIASMMLLSRENNGEGWNLDVKTNLMRFLETRSRWIECELNSKENEEDENDDSVLNIGKLRRLLDIVRDTIECVSVIFSDNDDSLLEKRLLLVLNSISSPSSKDTKNTLRRVHNLFQILYDNDNNNNDDDNNIEWISKQHTRAMYEKWLSDKVLSVQNVTEQTLKTTTNIRDLATVQASLGGLQSRRSEDDLQDVEDEKEGKRNLTPNHLWALLFRDRFRERMQHLLQDAFEGACKAVEKRIEERRRQLVAEEASSNVSSSILHLSSSPSTHDNSTICEEFDKVFGDLLEDVRVLFSNDGVLHREALGKRPEHAMLRLLKYFHRCIEDYENFSILIARVCWTLYTQSSVLKTLCPEMKNSKIKLPSSSSSSVELEFSKIIRLGIERWTRFVGRDAANCMRDKTFESPYNDDSSSSSSSSTERPSSSLCAALFSVVSRLAQCSEGLDESAAMYREMRQGVLRESSNRLWEVWSSSCSERKKSLILTVDYYVLVCIFGENEEMKRLMMKYNIEEQTLKSCLRDAEHFITNSSLLLSSLFMSQRHRKEILRSEGEDDRLDNLVYVAPVAPRFALLPVNKSADDSVQKKNKQVGGNDVTLTPTPPTRTTTQNNNTPTKALQQIGGELFSKAKSLWRQ